MLDRSELPLAARRQPQTLLERDERTTVPQLVALADREPEDTDVELLRGAEVMDLEQRVIESHTAGGRSAAST